MCRSKGHHLRHHPMPRLSVCGKRARGLAMIAARFEFDGWHGWHQVPSIDPGPMERIAISMQRETVLLRLKAMMGLIETQEILEAA